MHVHRKQKYIAYLARLALDAHVSVENMSGIFLK